MHYPIPAAWSRQDIIDRTIQECDARGVPREGGLALEIAESNLDQYAERWGYETEYAKNLIAMIGTYGLDYEGEWGNNRTETGRQAFDAMIARINAKTPHDISFGVGQQIVKYAPVGTGEYDFENVMTVRSWLFDPGNSIPLAIEKYAGYYDASQPNAVLRALCLYNWPGGGGAPYQGNGANYRRAIAQAEAILGR